LNLGSLVPVGLIVAALVWLAALRRRDAAGVATTA
jgi:hypothetical protein